MRRPYIDMSDPAVRRLVLAAYVRQRAAAPPVRVNWPLVGVLAVWFCLWGGVAAVVWRLA